MFFGNLFMSETFVFPLPKYVTDLPEEEQAEARSLFVVKLAALYADRLGTMPNLARVLGVEYSNLFVTANSKTINAKYGVLIEKLLGKELFSIDWVCPHLKLPE
jgi:hypothetical protein